MQTTVQYHHYLLASNYRMCDDIVSWTVMQFSEMPVNCQEIRKVCKLFH